MRHASIRVPLLEQSARTSILSCMQKITVHPQGGLRALLMHENYCFKVYQLLVARLNRSLSIKR